MTQEFNQKQPFDIDTAMTRIQEAIRPFSGAALFALADEGFRTRFELLVACILSTRTRDETMLVVAHRLFARARTPSAIAELPVAELASLIKPVTFYGTKADQIHRIAQRVANDLSGIVPAERELLLSFSGVGPKCANLVLGIAGDGAFISVDTHVHRITNRWGYVHTTTPEETLAALEARLPRAYWVEINRALVPFGKHVCLPATPRCAECPLLDMCPQHGVSGTGTGP